MNTRDSSICHGRKQEAAPMSFNRCLVQKTETRPWHGALLSNKDKLIAASHSSSDASPEECWVREFILKDDLLCDSICVAFLKGNVLEKHDSLVVVSTRGREKKGGVLTVRCSVSFLSVMFWHLGAFLALERLPLRGRLVPREHRALAEHALHMENSQSRVYPPGTSCIGSHTLSH